MNEELQALLEKIYRERGIDLRHYKENFIVRRVKVRLRALGATSYRKYMHLLDDDEYDHLLEALTINLTSFFRDPDVFQAIRDAVLRPLILAKKRTAQPRLDIWSAGCASGEEAYSLAIMVHQLLGNHLPRWRVRILGTDIDAAKLEQARLGVYGAFSFRGTRWPSLERYFVQTSEGRAVIPEIKRLVQFRRHNMISAAPPGRFDLILCRNVFIYLQREQQLVALHKFHKALKHGGFLVLGKSEILSANATPLFEIVVPKARIYRKKATHTKLPLEATT